MSEAVLLLSGGLDSATTGAMAAERGFTLCALSFAYGQRHEVELASARSVAASLGVKRHVVQTIDLRIFGGSALTADIDVPTDPVADKPGDHIPVTYVPARNTIFLSHGLAYAETIGAFDIFIGVGAVDYSGYPDCRPAFIEKFEQLANVATAAAVNGEGRYTIHAPLLHLSKADVIREGLRLGVDYRLTHSCYAPTADGGACARCESCQLRAKGFRDAGVPDPTRYASEET